MQTKEIIIGNRIIGYGHPCFIVAEVSCNHQQNFDQAVAIVKAAAEAGADAVKLQTYTPDTMTINSKKKWFYVNGTDNPDTWKGKTFYDLYGEAYTPWEWHKDLKKIANELGLIFFSTPFDKTAVDFLETLNLPCYKIASYECTDIPLLKRIAETGKPVIMSIGFATLDEAELSIQTLIRYGAKNIVVLQCTTSYKDTGDPRYTNLRTMLDIRKRFDVLSGFSDNMGGIEIPIFAASVGACIIEKHLVVNHDPKILDDRFSLDKNEFKNMVASIRMGKMPNDKEWQDMVLGEVKYGPQTQSEEQNRNYRRSIFVVRDIKKNDIFTEENIRCIRPAYGLEPKHYFDIIGKTATKNIEAGTPLSSDLVQK